MSPFGKLALVALVCYFAFVVYRAVKKLESRDIGTIFTTKTEKTVQDRSEEVFCNNEYYIIFAVFCSIRQPLYAFIGSAIGTLLLLRGNLIGLIASS